MVYSSGWSVVVAERYDGSNAEPSLGCHGDAYLSYSISRSVQLRWRNGNSRFRAKRKFYASNITLCAFYLIASRKLAYKAKIPPRSLHVRNTSELSCTLPPRNHTDISWNDHIWRWRILWFDVVCRMRMERPQLPFPVAVHAHTSHHVKPKHSWTACTNILRYFQVIL